jgi:hypothetical protein
MDRLRIERRHSGKDEGSRGNVAHRYLVGQVENARGRVQAGDDGLASRRIPSAPAEVAQKRDYLRGFNEI